MIPVSKKVVIFSSTYFSNSNIFIIFQIISQVDDEVVSTIFMFQNRELEV
jgi:hypothetical protein